MVGRNTKPMQSAIVHQDDWKAFLATITVYKHVELSSDYVLNKFNDKLQMDIIKQQNIKISDMGRNYNDVVKANVAIASAVTFSFSVFL